MHATYRQGVHCGIQNGIAAARTSHRRPGLLNTTPLLIHYRAILHRCSTPLTISMPANPVRGMMSGMAERPSGMVTFLFTDVEGSTRLWAADRDGMSASLAVHDRVIRESVESSGGVVFATGGDSFAAAFTRASEATAAAVAAQVALSTLTWPGPVLRVRMGIHLGEAEERGGDYFGPVVNAAARVEAAGHGGQILLTEPVRALVDVDVVTDLGIHSLRDLPEPVRLFQVGAEEFAPLRGVTGDRDSLPVRRTRLLGRDTEVGTLVGLFDSARLVTIG
jgi:class 3 adenylate cyclase